MVNIKVISASILTAKDLRAAAYTPDPKKLATTAVQKWNSQFGGVVALRSRAGRSLVELVEQAIRAGLEKQTNVDTK